MRASFHPLPALLYSPRILVFITFPHSLHSSFLSRIPRGVIVSDNPSTDFPSTTQQTTTQHKNE